MNGHPPLLPWIRAAAELEGLAGWLEDELAGGAPPKYLVQVAATAARYIADKIRESGGAK